MNTLSDNHQPRPITRDEFMEFFRDVNNLDQLSPDDRVEVFSTILLGSSDLKKSLLDSILADYCVTNLHIADLDQEKPTYVLFGEEATDIMTGKGVEGLMEAIKTTGVSWMVSCYDYTTPPSQILQDMDGWMGYDYVEKQDYDILMEYKNRQK